MFRKDSEKEDETDKMVGGKNNARQRRGEVRARREKLRLRMVNMRTLKHEGPKW